MTETQHFHVGEVVDIDNMFLQLVGLPRGDLYIIEEVGTNMMNQTRYMVASYIKEEGGCIKKVGCASMYPEEIKKVFESGDRSFEEIIKSYGGEVE